jgi:hypothetical protein
MMAVNIDFVPCLITLTDGPTSFRLAAMRSALGSRPRATRRSLLSFARASLVSTIVGTGIPSRGCLSVAVPCVLLTALFIGVDMSIADVLTVVRTDRGVFHLTNSSL